MIFYQYSRDCLYEKAIDIYSRRGAENAKEDEYIDTVFAKKYMSPLRSLRLCEKTGYQSSNIGWFSGDT